MTRKMLLSAVGDYQGYASKLVSTTELDNWERVLSQPPYDLTVLGKPLKDATATRDAILAGLDALLAGAQPNDELIWVFLGHGSMFGGNEQALIAYPEGNSDLSKAAICYSDVLDRLKKYNPPADTDLTFIIDSCFAERFAGDDAIPLFIPPSAALRESRSNRTDGTILRFADLAMRTTRKRERDDAHPGLVILSAALEDQSAYQIPVGRTERLLFSYRATERLDESHETFDQLVESINPLRENFPQEAIAHGTSDRKTEKFPGEPETPKGRRIGFGAADSALATENFIRMRVLGMGCFIEKRADTTDFENRVVFPYDTVGTGDNKHFGFIEVAEGDTSSFTGDLPYKRYTRGGVAYRRWTLTEHRVLLYNADLSNAFMRSAAFTYHVPGMPDICPELNGKQPRPECYKPAPNPRLFSGFVDLSNGYADIAELEEGKTFFTRQVGGAAIPWTPRQTPRSVFVTQPFVGEKAIIVVETLSGASTTQIFVKAGATIMVGNAREKDLTGDGSGDPTRDAFLIYYEIAVPSEKPDNPALPAVYSAPVNACSVTRWP